MTESIARRFYGERFPMEMQPYLSAGWRVTNMAATTYHVYVTLERSLDTPKELV